MDNHKIAIVCASWHKPVVDSCYQSFVQAMTNKGFKESQLIYFSVPGSLEIPLTAQRIAKTKEYSAIIAIGFIVDGGIYRHEFVAQAVLDGLMNVQLTTGVPILSAVLTPQKFDETSAEDNKFFVNHMIVKGKEVADACVFMIS